MIAQAAAGAPSRISVEALRILLALRASPLWTSNSPAAEPAAGQLRQFGLDWAWFGRRHLSGGPEPWRVYQDPAFCLHRYREGVHLRLWGPNALFDEAWYRARYPDVAPWLERNPGLSAWDHFLSVGAAARRNPSWWFDEEWYLHQQPDAWLGVRNHSLVSGLEHFLLYGCGQDLAPSLYFQPAFYRRRYLPEATQAAPGREPALRAFLRDGLPRGHTPAPILDPGWYAEMYLAGGKAAPDASPVEHYFHIGIWKAYSASPLFDEASYREIHAEVRGLIADGEFISGLDHYLRRGSAEGFVAPSHLPNGGLDYSGPPLARYYERVLLLACRQSALLRRT